MIRSMDMVNFIGQMEDVIEGIGKMGNNTVEEFIEEVMEQNEKENGLMGKSLDGWMNDKLYIHKVLII